MTIVNLCLLKSTHQYLDQEGIYSLLLFIDHPTLISNFLLMLCGIWGRDKLDAISQTTFSSAFSSLKMFGFQLKFHWSFFLWLQLTIFQQLFSYRLGAVQTTSHYLNQWWLDYRRIYASLGLNELKKVQQENKLLYFIGDYNIKLLNVDSHSLTADFNDTIYSYGLVPLITRPTKVTETSATYLPKGISYDESMNAILVSDISDHYTIFCTDKILKHMTIYISYLQRDYSERKKINFINDISVLDWQDVHSAANAQHVFFII